MVSPLYAVFACTGTQELYDAGKKAGFDVWIPVVQVRREYQKIDPVTKAATIKMSLQKVPAMGGYIFCRFDQWTSFLAWCPDKHALRIHMATAGDADAVAREYNDAKVPAQVHWEELQHMLDMCDSLAESLYDEQQSPDVFNVRDKVSFHQHPLFDSTITAEIVKCRPTGYLRVFVHQYKRYVEVHRGFVRLCS